MILCTLDGPDPRAFNTSRRGAEVGKPLRDGESYLFEKRRAEVGATLSSKFTGLCHRYQLSRALLDMTVAARYALLPSPCVRGTLVSLRSLATPCAVLVRISLAPARCKTPLLQR
jgi:hypothetical protein